MNFQEALGTCAPIESRGGVLVKRGDLIDIGRGINGLKVVGCLHLINDAIKRGKRGFITVGSRESPQCLITSHICRQLHLPCHVFMPDANEKTEIQKRIKNNSAIIHPIKNGYNSVLFYHAKNLARENPDLEYLPFGLSSRNVIDYLARQAENIPESVSHITIPVGSGSNLCSLLWGLYQKKRLDISVLGIIVGSNGSSRKHIEENLPPKYNYQLEVYYPDAIKDLYRYRATKTAFLGGLRLHPIYEAKCSEFIRRDLGEKELFWVVGA